MKCQKCPKAATLHITEVLSDEQFEELHLCEECAHKYLYEPQPKGAGTKAGESGQAECQVVFAPASRERLVRHADEEIRLTYGELTALIEDAVRQLK